MEKLGNKLPRTGRLIAPAPVRKNLRFNQGVGPNPACSNAGWALAVHFIGLGVAIVVAVFAESRVENWENWQRKRRIGRKSVSRSLSADEVRNLEEAWLFARDILRKPLNRAVTIKPRIINELNPVERQQFWQDLLNKFGQFARDHDYSATYTWSRESDPADGANEHLHALVHVPARHCGRFGDVVSGWYPLEGETLVKPAHYRFSFTCSGKRKSAIGYLAKNSPQAAYKTWRMYRKGGPILGKRAGCTRNIDAPARGAWWNSLSGANDNVRS